MGYDPVKQQEILHPLVNAVHLASSVMKDSGTDIKAALLADVNDLPKELKELPWAKKVQAVYERLNNGENCLHELRELFLEGKQPDILPDGYLV